MHSDGVVAVVAEPGTRRARREAERGAAIRSDPQENTGPASASSGRTALAEPIAPSMPDGGVPQQRTAPQPPRGIPVFGARRIAQDLLVENDRLQGELERLNDLVRRHGLLDIGALEETKAVLRDEIAESRRRLADETAATRRELADEAASTRRRLADEDAAARRQLLEVGTHIQKARTERDSIQRALIDLRETAELQDAGLFDFEHPAEASVSLASRLEGLRSEIKSAVRAGRATQATTSFVFNGSEAKGRKFVGDMSKLMLRAYNAEAENCVKSVRAGNLAAAQKRLSGVVTQVERLGTMVSLRIDAGYHRLRLQELELASRHLQALQREKELERERREELREQKKAERELAAEKARLEKERTHYANVIQTLQEKGDIEGAQRMIEKLDDVVHAIDNVDYRAANVRAGYVYVISNVGSFGPDVVKIGLTRRLDPMDRVNELGDASVPFRFDVHALFFAEDAVAIETMLHRHFEARRINKVNMRREYFKATPEEVRDALREHSVEVLEFKIEPEAAEYRTSTSTGASS